MKQGLLIIFAKIWGGFCPPSVCDGSAILKLLQVYVGAVVIFYHARQSFRSSCTDGDRSQWVENISDVIFLFFWTCIFLRHFTIFFTKGHLR